MQKTLCLLISSLLLCCSCALAEPGKTWTKNTRAGLMTFTEVDGVSNVRQFLGFYDGVAGFEQNGHWGAIDTQGNVIFDAYWDEMTIYSDGLAGVKKNGKWGCIDREGYIVIDPVWDAMESTFSEGLRAVSRDGQWGFIDTKGQIVIEPQFQAAHNFSEGLAAVKTGGKWGYINADGLFVLTPQWKGGLSASNQKNYGSGKNFEGSEIYGKYDDAGDFCCGRAVLTEIDGTYTLIDNQGNVLVESASTRMIGFEKDSNGLMLIYQNGVGFMDANGNIPIRCNSKWKSGFGFHEGYANVAEVSGSGIRGYNYTWYYIDTNGKRLGNKTWDWCWSFLEGKAIVQKNNKLGYIDTTGELLFDMENYGFITDFVNDYAMVLRNGKMVIIHCDREARASEAAAAVSSEAVASASSDMWVYITNSKRVNVRAESHADSARVGFAESKKTYPCLGIAENGWYQIALDDGTVGYISGKMGKLVDNP